MTDLDALAALAEAATPGPWTHDDESDYQGLVRIWRDIDPPPVMTMGRVHAADAAYIAAADPTTILALVERLRAAEAVCDRVLAMAAFYEWDAPANTSPSDGRWFGQPEAALQDAIDGWEATRGK